METQDYSLQILPINSPKYDTGNALKNSASDRPGIWYLTPEHASLKTDKISWFVGILGRKQKEKKTVVSSLLLLFYTDRHTRASLGNPFLQ